MSILQRAPPPRRKSCGLFLSWRRFWSRLSVSGTYTAIVDNETLEAKRADYVETLLPRVMAHEDAIGVDGSIFEYRVTGDDRPLHSSYVKKK